jgi:hypothetical protein
MAELAAA